MTQRYFVVDYENYLSGLDKIGIKALAQTIADAEWVIKTVSALWRNQSQYLEQEEPVSDSILDSVWNTEKTYGSVRLNGTNLKYLMAVIYLALHNNNPYTYI